MDEFKIRPATNADIPILIQQRRRMFEDMGTLPETEVTAIVEAFGPYIHQALREKTYQGFLAETAEGEVVAGGGVMIYNRLGRSRAYICNVYTEKEYRRRGLARQVMETMLTWCRAEGFTLVDLHASAEGRPLYLALGFEPTNELRLTFK